MRGIPLVAQSIRQFWWLAHFYNLGSNQAVIKSYLQQFRQFNIYISTYRERNNNLLYNRWLSFAIYYTVIFQIVQFLRVWMLWFMCIAVYLDWLLHWKPWSTHAFTCGMPSALTKKRERDKIYDWRKRRTESLGGGYKSWAISHVRSEVHKTIQKAT